MQAVPKLRARLDRLRLAEKALESLPFDLSKQMAVATRTVADQATRETNMPAVLSWSSSQEQSRLLLGEMPAFPVTFRPGTR